MNVKVIKGNRVLDVPEHHVQKFISKGYELYDKKVPENVVYMTPPKQEKQTKTK